MKLRQKVKKLKKENEILKKTRIIPMKPIITPVYNNYETLRISRIMMVKEVPIEEYKHQVALDIANYLDLNNYIDWEISEDIPLKRNKIIGTIKVVR